METAALIIILGSALLAGAAALGLAWLVGRIFPLVFPAWWAGVGGVLAGALVSLAVITGWPSSMFADPPQPVEAIIPWTAELRLHEPDLQERLETLILRDQQDGRSQEEVRTNAMALLFSYVADKTARLPDQLLIDLYVMTRDEMANLAERGEDAACADVALGRIRGDLMDKLEPDVAERLRTIIRRVIVTPSISDGARMGAEPFAALATQAFAAASHSNGIDPAEVDTLLAGSGDPGRTCRLMKSFFDEILAQSTGVAASALRKLSDGERGR